MLESASDSIIVKLWYVNLYNDPVRIVNDSIYTYVEYEDEPRIFGYPKEIIFSPEEFRMFFIEMRKKGFTGTTWNARYEEIITRFFNNYPQGCIGFG